MSKVFDTSYLYQPQPEKPGERFNDEGWGYLNINDVVIQQHFEAINNIVKPRSVVEIGMFAGHSTILMLDTFKGLQQFTSYDPNHVAEYSAKEIGDRDKRFSYFKSPIWGHEHRHDYIDLMFVDGDHGMASVIKDIRSVLEIMPRYVLFDNLETSGVSGAIKKADLYNTIFNPQFFFYVNHHKNNVKPGILGLMKLEGVSESVILKTIKDVC